MRPAGSTTPGPLWRRLAWFGGLWLASVLALGAIAMAIRLALRM